MALPTEMKALILEDNAKTLNLETRPFPSPTPGSLTVKVLATLATSTLVDMLRGSPNAHSFTQPRPLIPGGNVIGRVVALGPDAVSMKVGQLVAIEPFVRARDDPNVQILWGMYDGQTAESKKLYRESWRDGGYAEYVRAPLENVYALNEEILCGDPKDGGFGYSTNDLTHVLLHATPYGGLRSINLQAGETLIVSPATGLFSGAAISTALAMGAIVIGVSRSADGLAKIKSIFPAVRTVQLTGDIQADTGAIIGAAGRQADAFLDLSPPAATGTTGVTSCMLAVKPYGRICLMGGRGDQNIPVPWPVIMYRNLTIKGGFMYEREDVRGLIRLLESGQLKLGEKNGFEIAGTFKLDEWEKCADAAIENNMFGKVVLLNP